MIGIFAGSFDPWHFGHTDLLERSLRLCDHVIIAIGINPAKNTFFTKQERFDHIAEETRNSNCQNIEVKSFQGLLVEFAKEQGANVLIRGVRSMADLEYEMTMATINRSLVPSIETIFLPTKPELSMISSSAVKEVAKFGGDISQFVSPAMAREVKRRIETLNKQEKQIWANGYERP